MFHRATMVALTAFASTLVACGSADPRGTDTSEDTEAVHDTAHEPDPKRPTYVELVASFGWDDSEGATRGVKAVGQPLAPGLVLVLWSQHADPNGGETEGSCRVFLDADFSASPSPPEGDHRLALDVVAKQAVLDGCDGWDLSRFGDDPSAWFAELAWRIDVGGALAPEFAGVPGSAERWLGATVRADELLGHSRTVVLAGGAVDEAFDARLEEVEPNIYQVVPLTPEAMLSGDVLSDGLYLVRSPYLLALDE